MNHTLSIRGAPEGTKEYLEKTLREVLPDESWWKWVTDTVVQVYVDVMFPGLPPETLARIGATRKALTSNPWFGELRAVKDNPLSKSGLMSYETEDELTARSAAHANYAKQLGVIRGFRMRQMMSMGMASKGVQANASDLEREIPDPVMHPELIEALKGWEEPDSIPRMSFHTYAPLTPTGVGQGAAAAGEAPQPVFSLEGPAPSLVNAHPPTGQPGQGPVFNLAANKGKPFQVVAPVDPFQPPPVQQPSGFDLRQSSAMQTTPQINPAAPPTPPPEPAAPQPAPAQVFDLGGGPLPPTTGSAAPAVVEKSATEGEEIEVREGLDEFEEYELMISDGLDEVPMLALMDAQQQAQQLQQELGEDAEVPPQLSYMTASGHTVQVPRVRIIDRIRVQIARRVRGTPQPWRISLGDSELGPMGLLVTRSSAGWAAILVVNMDHVILGRDLPYLDAGLCVEFYLGLRQRPRARASITLSVGTEGLRTHQPLPTPPPRPVAAPSPALPHPPKKVRSRQSRTPVASGR